MDDQKVRAWEAQCVEEQLPGCTTNCPARLDVRRLVGHVREGDFTAALAVFARSVPFPAIVSRICDHPCEAACRRGEAGDAIRINALERACVELGKARAARRPQGQRRKKRIGVVGAGLSGLTVAADLAAKGYAVVVFEAAEHCFHRLLSWPAEQLPPAAVAADLGALHALGVEFRCGTTIGESGVALASALEQFDALYLGVGPVAFHDPLFDSDGRIAVDPVTFATAHPRLFAGGSHRYGGEPYSPITSLADGRYAALSIDRFCQGASLAANREPQGITPSRLYTDIRGFAPLPAVVPADPRHGYTAEEAIAEAQRCFPCHCLECVKACEYLKHYGAYPKRYVREIYNNDGIVLGNHKANRMANSCSLCGLCAALCPDRLDMGEVCLEARESMVGKGKMPPSFHDFALRDMEFSSGEAFALARHQPGASASAAVFFPGCQLSASSPEAVGGAYAWLRQHIAGGVGLMLGCCGAPARWAGQAGRFDANAREFTANWQRLGQPEFIVACPTCQRMLEKTLPEGRVVSLWAALGAGGVPGAPAALPTRPLAIHDPCTARKDQPTQDSVRRLLAGLGVAAIELDGGERTTCCGFGGLAAFVNPEVAEATIRRRIGACDADYVTYCAMCRDSFARHGKRAVHVLHAARPDPGFSRRQENRARLKATLLRTLWEENMPTEEPPLDVALSPAVAAEAERRQILLDDIRTVIEHAERTGEKFVDGATGHTIASHRPISVTYWVEYEPAGSGFTVHRVWSHRMEVAADGQP